MDNSLPERFEEFGEARRKGFIKAKELKDAGGRLAGIFCSYTPVEILDAAGLISVSLCGMSEETIPDAERVLPKNLCPLIKSSYGFAISDKCPYTHFADIIVGETTCDGKKKMYELLGDIKDVFILHLPQGPNQPYSLKMWISEIKRLIDTLEKKFSIKITDDKIREAVKIRNRERQIKCKIFELTKPIPPKCYTKDIHKVLDSLNFTFDRENTLNEIEKLILDIENQYNDEKSRIGVDKKRILLTGCPISGVFDKTIKYLEENGAAIVALDSCAGPKSSLELIDESADDIIEAIAKKYLNIGCAVMTPDINRMKQFEMFVSEYNVDGVVEIVLQDCQPFDIERVRIKELCNKMELPYLGITTDYSHADDGQLKTRFDAFIEMLR